MYVWTVIFCCCFFSRTWQVWKQPAIWHAFWHAVISVLMLSLEWECGTAINNFLLFFCTLCSALQQHNCFPELPPTVKARPSHLSSSRQFIIMQPAAYLASFWKINMPEKVLQKNRFGSVKNISLYRLFTHLCCCCYNGAIILAFMYLLLAVVVVVVCSEWKRTVAKIRGLFKKFLHKNRIIYLKNTRNKITI